MPTWTSRDFKTRFISRLREHMHLFTQIATLKVEEAPTSSLMSMSMRVKVTQLKDDPPRYFVISIKEEM